MPAEPDVEQVAGAIQLSMSLLVRRLRQVQADGELTLPERSALSRLDRGGPTTATALARAEQISPQSMGATISALEARGLVDRRPDPTDGRRAYVSITTAGGQAMASRRAARTEHLAQALSAGFSPAELQALLAAAPLLERLAASI